MPRRIPAYVITDRDRRLFAQLFENRVMLLSQIHQQVFSGKSRQIVSRRLAELSDGGFLDRRKIDGRRGSAFSAFSNKPAALKEIANSYRYAITTEMFKSDSVRHDISLVKLRNRLERLATVTNYFSENMLQACGFFSDRDETRPFVQNNSDAVIELTRGGKKLLVGLEFESSEKAKERYIRKLVSYYTDGRTPVVLYVCENQRIQSAIAQAESEVIGKRPPRCHYALLENVLTSAGACTFSDLRGASIVLS